MPNQKSSPVLLLTPPDRLPARQVLFTEMRLALEGPASFYGFERMHLAALAEAQVIGPLQKAGLLEERAPVTAKLKTGEEIVLRPGGAVFLLHAYTVLKMNDLAHPLKLSFGGESFFLSMGPGARMRSIDEEGLVMIGEEGPIAEAEIVQVIWNSLPDMGISVERMRLEINATGCNQCRGQFRPAFNAHFRSRLGRLCSACKRRFKKNPTAILGCTEEKCAMLAAGAPQILDYLCESCKKHLRGFLEFMDECGIPYFLNTKLFREGSWYTALLFQIVADERKTEPEAGEQPAAHSRAHGLVLAEGGRMSRAGELMVGRRIDAVAGTLWLEHVERARHAWKIADPEPEAPRIFLAQLGELAKRKSMRMLEMLRQHGIPVRESLGRDSLKSQLTVAARIGAEIALVIGQKEAIDATVIVREVESGIQETIPQERLVDFLKKRLGSLQKGGK